ncbi:MAG: TonB-dependent receptor [Bryobacteraceae bacterium]|jgi:hypothetical protein
MLQIQLERTSLCIRVLLILLLAATMHAQTQTASVTGTVTDPTGAVIPNAVITLVNTSTNIKVDGHANENGIYLISFLNPGPYTFTAEAPGMRGYTRTLQLVTGQVLQLDLAMELGQAANAITVTAATPLLQSANSDINSLVENSFIKDMPMESDRAGSLVRLLPGVAFQQEETFEPQLDFSLAGGPARSNEYRLDGGSVTLNALLTRTIEFNPPVEATQELQVEVNAYPAEYGHAIGGVFHLTTKSGTNQFHGNIYENLRNNDFDARSFFAPSIPVRHYNVFGTEVDGPIRKNKTFFMVSYEGTRRVDGETRTYSYPSPQEVAGNFSDQSGTLMDPLSKTPFPGNVIPPSRMDPVGAKLAALYPAPNVAGAKPGANNFIANTADHGSQDSYLAKIDHTFREQDRVAFRGIFYPAVDSLGNAAPLRAIDIYALTETFHLWNLGPSWYHTFGPTLFSEAHFTYSHRDGAFPQGVSYNVVNQVGLTGVPNGMPEVDVTGETSLGASGEGPSKRLLSPQITESTTEGLTWLKGKHNVKFGGEWVRSLNHDDWYGTPSGDYAFNNVATGTSTGLAALELGWVNTAAVVTSNTWTRTDYLAGYIQDDWKLSSRLTLNIGLRYDFSTPRWEIHNQQSGFNPAAINPVSGTRGIVTFAGVNGVSKYANNFETNDFGPRFGFAWRAPKDFVVLRGGYGLIYGAIYDASLGRALDAGYTDQRNFTSPDNGVTPAFTLQNGMPQPDLGAQGPGFGAVPVGQKTIFTPDFIDQNHRTLYAHHFNASLQRQLTGTMLLELEYLGNMGHHFGDGDTVSINEIPPQLRGTTQSQLLRPFPQYTDVTWRAPNWGNSTYNALNVKVEKRFSNGLNFLATYTWSKFLTDMESSNEIAGASDQGQQSYYARHLDKGLSGNDMRNRFATSAVYELPIGKNKLLRMNNSVFDRIAGGWSVGVISEIRSGSPYSVYMQTNDLEAFSPGQRANIVGNQALPTDRPRAQRVREWFNTAAYAFPGNGILGDASRSPGTGPGFINFDTSVLKDIHVTEFRYFQLSGRFFNTFNRANFSIPNGSLGSPAFGTISSTVNQGRYTQVTLRYIF